MKTKIKEWEKELDNWWLELHQLAITKEDLKVFITSLLAEHREAAEERGFKAALNVLQEIYNRGKLKETK